MLSKFTVQATEEMMGRGAGGEMVCWRCKGDQHGTAAEVSGFDREVALALPVLAKGAFSYCGCRRFPSLLSGYWLGSSARIKAAEQYVWIRITEHNVV